MTAEAAKGPFVINAEIPRDFVASMTEEQMTQISEMLVSQLKCEQASLLCERDGHANFFPQSQVCSRCLGMVEPKD